MRESPLEGQEADHVADQDHVTDITTGSDHSLTLAADDLEDLMIDQDLEADQDREVDQDLEADQDPEDDPDLEGGPDPDQDLEGGPGPDPDLDPRKDQGTKILGTTRRIILISRFE